MSTYEQAERVRDMIADRLLDGDSVVSVGIRNDGPDYGVGVTATQPVEIPALPRDLRGVAVSVVLTGGPAKSHSMASHAIGTFRRWWHRSC
ncbi:hypothetical protein [Mycolicibacterium llatzerense]|uniref:hypothetical protein n=1 Tax=Mycolicibacterium llatzerense TaxID=280871 RepID=UPI0021B5CB93|nr:hypothetical protein [Mycolicibacterium llatzerense]MCT7369607.1 hypothetical protein [Mycolicibacterium llatzerense]